MTLGPLKIWTRETLEVLVMNTAALVSILFVFGMHLGIAILEKTPLSVCMCKRWRAEPNSPNEISGPDLVICLPVAVCYVVLSVLSVDT